MNMPFSKFREVNDLVMLSGEVPLDEEGRVPEGIVAQTDLVMKRISSTLAQSGLGLSEIVSVTAYLTDKSDFELFNSTYKNYFSAPLPVRTTICCELFIDAKVELTVVAARSLSASQA